jgi:hypothetical protein
LLGLSLTAFEPTRSFGGFHSRLQAIKELATGWMAGRHRSSSTVGRDSNSIEKIVREIVHLTPMYADEISAEDEPVLIEWRGVRNGNVSGGLNKDTARTKR